MEKANVMGNYLSEEQLAYVKAHIQENIDLLAALGRIPAPSHQEDERAAFVKQWLENVGAAGVYIDEAKNVVYPIACEGNGPVVVIMAHMDIVFPDTTELPLRIEDGKMFAPGIGDDTANLVQLLMSAKYVTEKMQEPGWKKPECGIVFVANACEEGLGNLKGSRAIVEAFGSRIREFISFDGYTSFVTNNAVGSHRYEVTVKTEGGHSYGNFGNANAIYYLSSMIQTLYGKRVPTKAKTTYNVGTITGGTTVNSIAQEASMLYEFRSEDHDCLEEMEQFFDSVIDAYRRMGIEVLVDVKGIRPCKKGVDEAALERLTLANKALVEAFTGETCQVGANSTDSNIPLSMGIPANTIGVIRGGLAHTRQEWVDLGSVEEGFNIAMAVVQKYFQ